MIVIRVNAVADFGGLFHGYVDGENITVDANITKEGIREVNKILAYSHKKQDMSLASVREEYACAGSVR